MTDDAPGARIGRRFPARARAALLVAALLVACSSAPSPSPSAPSHEPTGRLLVLETKPCNWRQAPDPDRCDSVGLSVIGLDGTKLEDITPGASEAPIGFNSFALSASRDQVAWTWNWEVFVMDLDDREPRGEPRRTNEKVLPANQGERSFDPTWSPDGTELLYRSVGPNMVSTWFRNAVETGTLSQVRQPIDCWAMAWAPQGDMVACEVRRTVGTEGDESADIHLVDLATLETAPLTPEGDAVDDRRPDWSPDGQWVAVARSTTDASHADEVNGIWLLPAAGGEGSRVAAGQLSVPSWSPDGNHLAAFDDESMRIVTFGRDGSGFTTLEHEPRLFVAPRWIGD